ncbi:LPXTG cell wall anchor domain-containing protein [Streptococcus suis]|uniref:LPXTG cell wall anchor domain-containing protein n=1 Tax=Streptococcus suis TaxID=1307 RepID=UPI0009424464|nr:LPXTG cell wall anchor domain-containing protein [Streptococcus suis]HEM4874201.1 LPXTG cell wall anchor domain-containing protein [Streptococcus suis]
MSKQKVVSSLLLSTVVLGGLAFYSTTTVKAESLETDVTSVSSGDVVEKSVVSNEEGGDFLAEEELEDDETLEEELNEQAEEVVEPSSSEALLQPRAVMSNSETSGMEEIPVDDSVSVSEKIAETPLIQTTNADYKNYKNDGEREKFRTSVTIEPLEVEKNKLEWKVTFDTSEWSFNVNYGGLYFILPKGLKLTSIKDNTNTELFGQFPENVESSKNNSGALYRFFSKEENGQDDKNFDSQWGWSAKQAPSKEAEEWKSEGLMSKIYFIDKVQSKDSLTYRLTAERENLEQISFPVAAVMKSFTYKNSGNTEVTSLGARVIYIEKTKVQKSKEEAPKDTPEASPKPEEPQAPSATEEPKKEDSPQTPQAPSTPEEKPQVPESPTPGETQPEAPKKEDSPAPEVPSVPEEKPKKEEAPGQELPKPMEPKVDKPTPEVPKQEDVQPEAPKSDKVETDKPMPETKKPDMKQPKADDMPKEQQPKAEAPKAEQPQMDKPQMEAPKKDSEAPKSDKAETDKPMPETKQPDMKQPKADKPEAEKTQMPRTEGMKPESKASMMPKAEAPKATLPNTGEASSAIGWLGGALATLATGLYLFKNKKEE